MILEKVCTQCLTLLSIDKYYLQTSGKKKVASERQLSDFFSECKKCLNKRRTPNRRGRGLIKYYRTAGAHGMATLLVELARALVLTYDIDEVAEATSMNRDLVAKIMMSEHKLAPDQLARVLIKLDKLDMSEILQRCRNRLEALTDDEQAKERDYYTKQEP
jgi:hypothetical protein